MSKVEEREKKRDAAVEEIAALKEAEEGEAAGAEEQKKRIQAAESEGRRILEESQRSEVELRKLRVRYQVSRGRRAMTSLLFVEILNAATTSTCDDYDGKKGLSVQYCLLTRQADETEVYRDAIRRGDGFFNRLWRDPSTAIHEDTRLKTHPTIDAHD